MRALCDLLRIPIHLLVVFIHHTAYLESVSHKDKSGRGPCR